jgi:surfeit locus 1 family protein
MLAVHVLAVAAVLAAVLLGRWQYGAWHEGREDRAAALVNAAPRPLDAVMTSDQAFPGASVGRPVQLSGRWLPASTVYVADRDLDGRDGVWAVTPVAVCTSACGSAPAMLVVRGWAASAQDAPAAPSGRVRVTGWLQPGEGSGLSDPDPSDDVIPEMRIADAIQHVDQDLYGAYGVAEQPAPGLEAASLEQLPEVGALTSIRNLLYAIEWWFFGLFAAFIWWRWLTEAPESESEKEPGDLPVG